jgi:hypothetical protein
MIDEDQHGTPPLCCYIKKKNRLAHAEIKNKSGSLISVRRS